MNSNTTKLSKAIRLAIVLGAGALTAMPTINAEEADATEGDEAESTVVTITGSRIRRDEFASPSPIQIVSVDEAKEAGITNVADMIQRISLVNGLQIDNTINTNSGLSNASESPPAGGVGSVNVGLRGLGAERTLILINGRRLGASGVRGAPSQPDLSLIPIDMVERAEVLSDSASAVYGADAVAGVINLIMKDSFDGAQVSVNLSQPTDPGGEVTQISFITGGESDRFKFVLGGEYYNRERISLGDRENGIWQREIIAATGEQYNFYDNGFPDDALILGDGSWLFYEPGSTGDWTNPNNGQNIPNWTESGNLAADTWSGLFPFLPSEQVGFDRYRLNPAYSDVQERLNSDLVQPATRFSLITNASYMPEWGEEDNVEIFFESSYFHRHLKNIATAEQIYVSVPAELPVQIGVDSLGNPILDRDAAGEWITAANPLNPFGIEALPVITIDGFTQDRDLSLDHFRFVTGITGDVSGDWFKEKGWSYEIAASYDRGDGIVTQPQLDSRNFEKAQNSQYINLDGNVACGSTTNTPNELGGIIKSKDCVPLNILALSVYGKDGVSTGNLSPEEYAYLLGERVNGTTVTQAIFSGYATGDLFDFDDGGTASIVVGFESRRDHIESQADFNGEKGYFIAESPTTEGRTEGSRTIEEVFTEISLPILAGVDGVHELTADLALRYTDESNFGSESTERVRVLYAPTDWLSFSVAYGTSYRAPNLREQFLGDQTGGTGGGNDPCHAGAQIDNGVYDPTLENRSQTVLDNCALSGVDPTQLGLLGTTTIPVVISGNVDTLSPETSEQTTFTVKADVYESDNAAFNFAVTYFDIEIENTIASVGARYIMDRCYEDAPGLTSPFCSLVGPRDPNLPDAVNLITEVNDSFVNIGSETSEGFDINTRFSYMFEDVMGDSLEFIWTTQVTLTEDRTRTIIPEEGTDDLLGTHGTPEARFVQRMAFNYGDFSLIYSGRWVDETGVFTRNRDTSTCFADNAGPSTYLYAFENRPEVYYDCVAESKYYSDLALTWMPDDTFRATLGVSNITDESPAYVSTGLGNDRGGRMTGAGYDQVGQSVFLQATFKF